MKKFNFIFLFVLIFITKVNAHVSDITSAMSRSAKAGETINYPFELKNYTEEERTYKLSIYKPRLLASEYSLKKELVVLEPKGLYHGVLSVKVSDRIPVGGYEEAVLEIINNDSKIPERLEFITVRSKPHPYLLVTDELLEEAKAKIDNHQWARENFDELVEDARTYNIPKREVVTKRRNTRVWDSFNYTVSTTEKIFEKTLIWKLTGDTTLRNQVVQFVRDVCDTDEGYVTIGAATTGVQIHEGKFFLYLAAICDVLYGEDILSETDQENIALTFRHFIELQGEEMSGEAIMNHQTGALVGSLLATLFMEDMVALDHVMNSEGGLKDQFTKGTMPDGWWFESTPNYSYLIVGMLTLTAQAFENYGWNFYDRRFPVKFKSKDFENAKEGYTGMKFDIWGPMSRSTIGLEDMYTGHIPMMDEKAQVVSNNDSKITAPKPFYELAYRHFPKQEIAWVLSHTDRKSWQALLYGVPAIPEASDPRSESAFSPNVGITALRAKTKDLGAEDRISAYVKYGTHGGWHGHFDRTGLLALDRYGHKYFGTEMVWFGYGHAGYKECVQTSATHNMVIVDELQQEAVPSEQLLFHAGDLFQANVVQTNARWRKIPINNLEKFPPWDDKAFDSDFEPILQRRLTVVMDDYVFIADYMDAKQKHTYDWMLHPIGFEHIDGAVPNGKELDSLSSDKESPYKYFASAQWYNMKKGATAHFADGEMKLDVHTLWPKKTDALIANYPNAGKHQGIRNNPKRKTYGVRARGEKAVFLHVLEPFKDRSAIREISVSRTEEVTIELEDGRKQIIKLNNFKGEGSDIQVDVSEYMGLSLIRSEKAEGN